MPCTVIVGAFWGDEGKGKIISYLALKDNLDFCVRTGSVNAAHTVWFEGKKYALHMVPAAFLNPKTRLLIAAGANVDVKTFFDEVELTKVKGRIAIDQNASIIEEKHSAARQGKRRQQRHWNHRAGSRTCLGRTCKTHSKACQRHS